MKELLRETSFGQILRLVTGNRLSFLKYSEELDLSLYKSHVERKSPEAILKEDEPSGDDDEKDETNSKSSKERDESASGPSKQDSKDAEKGGDVDEIGWFGDNDSENPINWSTAKKSFVTFDLCFLTFGIYIGSAIYTPGVMGVSKQFGVSQVAAVLGLTLFVAGYGLGPMVWSPLSEIPQIGRNPIYIGTLLIFVLIQIPTALAPNFGTLLAMRFLSGLFGSPVLATGGASIADMYTPKKRAYAMGIWGISAICGPVLGPLVGGFAVTARGWSWSIWELMWLSGAAWVFLFFLLPETSSENIQYKRAVRLRKLTGNDKLKTTGEIKSAQMEISAIAKMVLVKPILLNFTEPIVFAVNLYIALVYGLLYIWFESFPLVFEGVYGFSLNMEGLAFVGILVGAIITYIGYCLYVYYYLEPRFENENYIRPEMRLQIAMFGSFFIPICLFWFGWSSRESIHWIMPIIGSAFFPVGAFLLFNSILNYLTDVYPTQAASVLAGNDLIRSAFGAGFPLFATAMYKKLGIAWASSLLGFLGIAFIPIPFFLYFYGEKIRSKSKMAG